MVRAEAAARLRLRLLSDPRPFTWLDVFADGPLEGNQLAVVHDADALAEARMLAFARETNLSETTFVQTATEPGADYRNRIWDTSRELPFAGHPSLGTAVAVAAARGAGAADYVQQTRAGLQPVRVERRGEEAWWASMLQNAAELGAEVGADRVLPALGLPAAAALVPPRIASTGFAHLIVLVEEAESVAAAEPDPSVLLPLLDRLGAGVAYLAHVDGERAHARSFVDVPGAGEDPATGSAAGPLAALVAALGGSERLEIAQGLEMGRPSRLVTELEDGRPRVSGGVRVVLTGTARL